MADCHVFSDGDNAISTVE